MTKGEMIHIIKKYIKGHNIYYREEITPKHTGTGMDYQYRTKQYVGIGSVLHYLYNMYKHGKNISDIKINFIANWNLYDAPIEEQDTTCVNRIYDIVIKIEGIEKKSESIVSLFN